MYLKWVSILLLSNVLDYFCVSRGYVKNHIWSVKNSLRKSSEGGKKRRKKLENVLDQEKETEPEESYLKGSY